MRRILQILLSAVLLIALTGSAATYAADPGPIKIGMLLDLSSVYADVGGKAHRLAGRMIQEDASQYAKRRVDVLTADFKQNLVDKIRRKGPPESHTGL